MSSQNHKKYHIRLNTLLCVKPEDSYTDEVIFKISKDDGPYEQILYREMSRGDHYTFLRHIRFNDKLSIQVVDWDPISRNDVLGTCVIDKDTIKNEIYQFTGWNTSYWLSWSNLSPHIEHLRSNHSQYKAQLDSANQGTLLQETALSNDNSIRNQIVYKELEKDSAKKDRIRHNLRRAIHHARMPATHSKLDDLLKELQSDISQALKDLKKTISANGEGVSFIIMGEFTTVPTPFGSFTFGLGFAFSDDLSETAMLLDFGDHIGGGMGPGITFGFNRYPPAQTGGLTADITMPIYKTNYDENNQGLEEAEEEAEVDILGGVTMSMTLPPDWPPELQEVDYTFTRQPSTPEIGYTYTVAIPLKK